MRLAGAIALLLDEHRLTVVDVGAAGGLHPRWHPAAEHLRTVNFEPLEEQRDDNNNLTLPYALGSSVRSGLLLVTERVSMTSLLPPASELLTRFWEKPKHTKIRQEVPVELRRLDDLARERQFRPDMLKIDVQGGEHDVLMGAVECLENSVVAAEIELSFFERYEGLTPFCGVVDFMSRHGFELFDLWRLKRYRHRNRAKIDNPGYVPGLRAGRLAFCDALFVRRDEALLDYVKQSRQQAGTAITLCLIYGKADLAARLYDVARDLFDVSATKQLDRYFRRFAGRFGSVGLHRTLDKWVSRV